MLNLECKSNGITFGAPQPSVSLFGTRNTCSTNMNNIFHNSSRSNNSSSNNSNSNNSNSNNNNFEDMDDFDANTGYKLTKFTSKNVTKK